MSIQTDNYFMLMQLAPEVLNGKQEFLKLESDCGMMPLSFDCLGGFRIAMAHNYTQNGDVMCDPDMEIEVYHKKQIAAARTYQQDGLGIYQYVEHDDGSVDKALERPTIKSQGVD